MNPRILVPLSCILGAAAVLAVGVSRDAQAAGKIEMIAVPTRSIEQSPPPGRAGNLERVRWSLRDRHGSIIGSALLNCRWHQKQERLCSGEVRLPLGKLTIAGSSATRNSGLWAVTGGTGRYDDAGGTLSFQAIGFAKLAVRITL
jgi:hypothetical protein